MKPALPRLDPSGNPNWAMAFTTTVGGVSTTAVAVDTAGNVVVGGVADSACSIGTQSVGPGVWLAKFDGTGKLSWTKGLTSAPSTDDPISAVGGLAFTPGGDVPEDRGISDHPPPKRCPKTLQARRYMGLHSERGRHQGRLLLGAKRDDRREWCHLRVRRGDGHGEP